MDKNGDIDTRIYCTQGPLHLEPLKQGALTGYRFVFKDLFDVMGYTTGAGNPKWLATHDAAQKTSSLIMTLLNQGASCVGRVQSDELAYSLNGQNIHYGTPINPVAPDCLPGGSSSGSAVAVANNQADFSIGTDTGGSVRVPASYCGLFGLRPTLAKLSLDNCFELAKSFDTAGIFTRDLALMEEVFSVLNNAPVEGESVTTLYLDNMLAEQMSSERLTALQVYLTKAGLTLYRGDFLSENQLSLESLSLLFRTIQGYEIIEKHGAWLEEFGSSLDPSIMQRVTWSRTITSEQYQVAKHQQADLQQKFIHLFQQQGGLWLIPTTPAGPPNLSLMGEELAQYRSDLMGLTSIAGLSGFPQLHIPISGLTEGPTGISLLGEPDGEGDLFATAQRLIKGGQL
jgi:aspartyl-tRNA(Asn)/glutamyl-tRNA(Gln) amidotransferase subunit A